MAARISSLLLLLLATPALLLLKPLRSWPAGMTDYLVSPDLINLGGDHCEGLPAFSPRRVLELEELASEGDLDSKADVLTEFIDWVMEDDKVVAAMLSRLPRGDDVRPGMDWAEFLANLWTRTACDLLSHEGVGSLEGFGNWSQTSFALADLVTRYQLCMRDVDVFRNCPGPCKSQTSPCESLRFSQSSCVPVMEKAVDFDYVLWLDGKVGSSSVVGDLYNWVKKLDRRQQLPGVYFEKQKDLSLDQTLPGVFRLQFRIAPVAWCICEPGFVFDGELKKCLFNADRLMCGIGNPCQNDGECYTTPFENNTRAVEIQCMCPPAYHGQFCELARDPCSEMPPEETCYNFPCRRDPYSSHGFSCVCPSGYRRESDEEPRCVDDDECQHGRVCHNHGVCENLDGGFRCRCQAGFEGRTCEIVPAPSRWTEWSEWGDCQWSEGDACERERFQEQTRRCVRNLLEQSCLGATRKRRMFCEGQEEEEECGEGQEAAIGEEELGESLLYDDEELAETMTAREPRLPSLVDGRFFLFYLGILVALAGVVWGLSSLLTDFLWFLVCQR